MRWSGRMKFWQKDTAKQKKRRCTFAACSLKSLFLTLICERVLVKPNWWALKNSLLTLNPHTDTTRHTCTTVRALKRVSETITLVVLLYFSLSLRVSIVISRQIQVNYKSVYKDGHSFLSNWLKKTSFNVRSSNIRRRTLYLLLTQMPFVGNAWSITYVLQLIQVEAVT